MILPKKDTLLKDKAELINRLASGNLTHEETTQILDELEEVEYYLYEYTLMEEQAEYEREMGYMD